MRLFSVLCFISAWASIAGARGVPAGLLPGISADADPFLEQSLPLAEIQDQGHTPYCAFHAMSSFLELWGDTNPGAHERLPTLDASYLAFAYNSEAANGAAGTRAPWLWEVVGELGVIPREALPEVDSELAWPVPDWRSRHLRLQPLRFLNPILKATYRHASSRTAFTGSDYLADTVQLDIRNFRRVDSTYDEPTEPSAHHQKYGETQYRWGDFHETSVHLRSLAKEEGWDSKALQQTPRAILHSIKETLYGGRPVPISLNVGLVRGKFRQYQVVTGDDLVPKGKGRRGRHAVVGVAHCDQVETEDPICARFASQMRGKAVAECFVIQNSWGEKANAHGYACLAPEAFRRMLTGATIPN